jgi:putrescine---pyruvate transaminase
MSKPDVKTLQKMDEAHYLHPFTDHKAMHAQGTHIILSGDKCWVVEEGGRKLLDGLAGLWCVNVGYNRPEIIEAIRKQLETLSFYPSFFNSTTEATIRLADRLAQIAPKGLKHAFFCNSGSEANESALKIVRFLHKLKGQSKKRKIMSRHFSYHGVTLATASMTGLPGCQTPFDLPLPDYIHAPAPYPYAANSPLDAEAYGKWCLEETALMIDREGADTIAALFAEPIQGAGGVIVPTASYLKGLRQLARDKGILFVADEVITGFGRQGEWFASQVWDLNPDLIIMAKGLTSGYLPMGGVMVSDEISHALSNGGTFTHGFTYSGHPVCAAGALANLDVIEKEKLIPRVAQDIGPYFQEKLRALSSHPAVGDVRGHLLIGALEVVPREGRAALAPTSMIGIKLAGLVREEGAIVRGIRDSIAISPALIISREEIDQLFAAIKRGLDRLWN